MVESPTINELELVNGRKTEAGCSSTTTTNADGSTTTKNIGTFVFSVLACLLYLARRSMVANVMFHTVSNVDEFVLEYVVGFSLAKPRGTSQQTSPCWPELTMLVMALPLLMLAVDHYKPRKLKMLMG